jgi:uncharacterized protein YggE
MRAALGLMLALAGAAAPAAAQTVRVIDPPAYGPAPWWMRQPIIASLGYVHTRIPANRASFSAEFQAVERMAPEATKAATAKVKALEETLRAFDHDKVRIETTISTRPLYEQYKDTEGHLFTNERPDKIERYQTSVRVNLTVYDVALLERVYATVMAEGPASAQPVYFSLQPDNATNTEMAHLAVADAADRARLSAAASGARIGAVKLIDPSGRACQTDVLVAGAPQSYGTGGQMVKEVVVTGRRIADQEFAPAPPPPPPPPPAPGGAGELLQLTLQPPLEELSQTACVVYALVG